MKFRKKKLRQENKENRKERKESKENGGTRNENKKEKEMESNRQTSVAKQRKIQVKRSPLRHFRV